MVAEDTVPGEFRQPRDSPIYGLVAAWSRGCRIGRILPLLLARSRQGNRLSCRQMSGNEGDAEIGTPFELRKSE